VGAGEASELTSTDLMAFALHYVIEEVAQVVTPDISAIGGSIRRTEEFNALVETRNGDNYNIVLYEGVLISLEAAIKGFDSGALYEEISDLAQEHAIDRERFRQVLLVHALLFVVLHEYGHIANGHFRKLLARQKELGVQQFSFDEISKKAFTLGYDKISNNSLEANALKFMELEADELAFSIMLGASSEVYYAISNFLEPHGSALSSTTARAGIDNLAYYSACIALCSIEATRNTSSRYPRPFTRIMNLINVQIGTLLGGVIGEVTLDSHEKRNILSSTIHLCFSALDIADAACSYLGVNLEDRFFPNTEGGVVATSLTDDAFIIMSGRHGPMFTEEGRQLRELRSSRAKFASQMKPFRVRH